MIPATSGIYRICNLLTGRFYIGSAVNMVKRMGIHVHQLRHNKHHSRKLQRAWNKAGELQFVFEVLESVPDKSMLLEREQFWMDETRACTHGYNAAPTAGSSMGRRLGAETRMKIGARQAGRRASAETRARMSATRKGVPKPAGHGANVSAAQRGKVIPPEVKAKMSAAAKARVARSVRRADGTFGAERGVEWTDPAERRAA